MEWSYTIIVFPEPTANAGVSTMQINTENKAYFYQYTTTKDFAFSLTTLEMSDDLWTIVWCPEVFSERASDALFHDHS